MPRTNNKKIKGKNKTQKSPPSTKETPTPVHLWVLLFHHESDELIRKLLVCDGDTQVDFNSIPTRLKFLLTTRQCWIRSVAYRDGGEIFLLSRELPSGRLINIDTHKEMLLKGGLGIAHIDMDHSNNKISNLRLVDLNEAIDILMNFEDDNEEEKPYEIYYGPTPPKIVTNHGQIINWPKSPPASPARLQK